MPTAKIVKKLKKDFAKFRREIADVKRYTFNEIAASKNDIKSHINNEIADIKTHTNNEISAVKNDVKSYTNNEIAKAKSDVKSHTNSEISKAKSYTNSEDKKLEGRLRDKQSKHSGGKTLHGSKSGPNHGTVY